MKLKLRGIQDKCGLAKTQVAEAEGGIPDYPEALRVLHVKAMEILEPLVNNKSYITIGELNKRVGVIPLGGTMRYLMELHLIDEFGEDSEFVVLTEEGRIALEKLRRLSAERSKRNIKEQRKERIDVICHLVIPSLSLLVALVALLRK